MKKLFIILAVLLILSAGFTYFKHFIPFFPQNSPTQLNYSTVKIGTTKYRVDLADDDNKRSQGLSGREMLLPDQGMLFIFNSKDKYNFWMKDMKFPLDFVWIDGDTIVDLTENVPAPLTATYTPAFGPKVPVDKVLEISAGEVRKNTFSIGQKVSVTLLENSKQ